MGFFDRFTGKEIESSIEEYTETYGEILLGMHQKLQKHEKQLDNMRSLTTRAAQADDHGTISFGMLAEITRLQELLEEQKDELASLSTQVQQSLRGLQRSSITHSNQLKENQKQIEYVNDKLHTDISQLEERITQTRHAVSLLRIDLNQLKQQLEIQVNHVKDDFKNEITKTNESIQDITYQLHDEINKTNEMKRLLTNQLMLVQTDLAQLTNRTSQIEIDIKEQNRINLEKFTEMQKQIKLLAWSAGTGIGILLIWEIIQLFI